VRYFLYRLARELGRTVAELEATMDAAEFVEWQAFYRVEHEIRTDTMPPIEYDDADQHSAAIDSLFS